MAVKKGIILLVIGIVIGAGILLYIQNKNRGKIKKENQELKEEIEERDEYIEAQMGDYLDYKKEMDGKIEERDRKIEESDEKIVELEKEKTAIIKERDEYKRIVAVAAPNYIVNEIGKRIGMENVRFKAVGVYELTREGANRVLFQMIDGESSERNYQKQVEITKEAEKKYDKEHRSRMDLEKALKKADGLIEELTKQNVNKSLLIKGLEKELAAKKRATLLQQGIAGGIGFLLGSVIN